jgi:TP901 family phage tail tape measure protein
MRVSTNQINNWRDALRLGRLVLRDMTTAVGIFNAAMNIMISRFGTMIIVFALFTQAVKAFNAAKEGFLELDTAIRKVASLVVATSGDIREAMKLLTKQMVEFGISVGVSFKQMSDTMFFLASAGLDSVRVFESFAAAQRLVIGTAKDMTATIGENKQVVEVFAGLLNVFGDSMVGFNSEQEKAAEISGILFQAFKTNQILIGELAVGLTFAAQQAKISGVSLKELVATLAVLNTNLLKGSKAGTSFANALRDAVQNADKLQKIGIDVSSIGTDSFQLLDFFESLGDVIERDQNKLRVLTELMEIFNIRGLRAVLVAADQVASIRKLTEDMAKGQENLNIAVKIASGSMKVQQQRAKNINTVLGAALAVAITGGAGFTKLTKQWNDLIERNLGLWIGVVAVIGEIVFGIKVVISSLLAMVKTLAQVARAMWEIRNNGFGRVGEDINKIGVIWSDFGQNVKEDQQGINRLWRVAFGEINSIEEALDGIKSDEQKLNELIEVQAEATSLVKENYEALNRTLERRAR